MAKSLTIPTRKLRCLAVLAFATLVGIGNAHADQLDCPCKVTKISDGDTVHVQDRRNERHKIRLGGIDAPESNQVFGNKSTQNLSRLIARKHVEVEFEKRDRYGRIVGKILKDGQDINLQQVKDGYAWHYKYYQDEQSNLDRALYESAETEARVKKIGLWSVPAVAPWDFRRRNR